MIKDDIAKLLEDAAIKAQEEGLLPPVVLPEVTVEHPPSPSYGDYAGTVPLKLARAARMDALKVAKALEGLIVPSEEIERIEVVPPGFINFFLKREWLVKQVDAILDAGESYGDIDIGQGLRVQVEFVSVNPTGPLHVGHGRGAVLGSTLSNVLTSAGYSVVKEYYINDAGSQMDSFYRSLHCRYLKALGLESEMPLDGYFGDYLVDMAREIVAEQGGKDEAISKIAEITLDGKDPVQEIGKIGVAKIIEGIKLDLELLGVEFDNWFYEHELYDEGQYQRVMSLLRERGYIGEREGAVWFVSTALGDDKDNVLVRSGGSPTYFASDIAYHYNKFLERGFDQVINIWGADHLGHVSRMKAVVGALGINPERLRIIIAQMVSLKRGQNVVKVSKRSGELITLRELIDEVGPDACLVFFRARSPDSQMDFDLELAKKQSADNPVYYIQYAHARISGILRLADERGIDYTGGDTSLITNEAELDLIRKMLQLPEFTELVARNLEPQHILYYSQELATAFHDFYEKCRVISDDEQMTRARLKLVAAARLVLAKSLRLMGVSAPERM